MNKDAKEALEAEISALNKVVNKVGHKNGGKILMKIAELTRKLNGLGQKEPHANYIRQGGKAAWGYERRRGGVLNCFLEGTGLDLHQPPLKGRCTPPRNSATCAAHIFADLQFTSYLKTWQ